MTPGGLVVAAILASLARPAAPADQKDCKPLADPRRMPGLDGVADSAGLLGKLAAVDSGGGEIIVSVWYADHPEVYEVDPILPVTPTHEAVLAAVAASLRPAQKNAPASFRLRTQLGKAPRVVLERSILCNPTTVEGDVVKGPFAVGRVTSSSTGAEPTLHPQTVETRARISATGEVLEVRLQAGSGNPEVDRSLLEAVRSQRFRPALLDGRPVDVWLRGNRVELVR